MKDDRKSSVNTRLRRARVERDWTQKDLARELGTTDVNVSRWERNKTSPDPYFRRKLSELFDKTPAELGLISPPSLDSRIVDIPVAHSPYFTGREKLLETLNKRLSTTPMVALTQAQALYGLGGIGKTQTAAEYAIRYSHEYTHIFWVLAASRDTLIADFVKLAGQLKLLEKDRQLELTVNAVKRWLAAHEGWLMILDNADDLPQAQQFLPANHKGFVLFTTRAQASGGIAASIEVEQLNEQEGSLLLLHCAKRLEREDTLDQAQPSDRAAAERIVKEVEGLPLAIVQAGAYIEETGCSLEDYLSIYATNHKELLEHRSQLLLGYPETVATTWALSFEQVKKESAAAADLLCLCAFLAPDAIPEKMLTRGASELGPILEVTATSPTKLNEALRVLRHYSLVRRNASTHTLKIHRLVQIVHRDSMDQEIQCTWAGRTVRAMNAAFPEMDNGSSKGYQYYLQYYLPHIQECATHVARYHLSFPEAAQMLFRTGAFLFFHGLYPQSQSLHQQALAIRLQLFGTDHPDVAASFNALGMLFRLQDDNDQAEEFHQQALAIREKVLGLNDPATAESLNNLGVLYRSQRKYEQAEPLLQEALSIRERLLGSKHPHTLISCFNLAKLYLEQGNSEQAERLLLDILATSKQALNPEHSFIAQPLDLLGKLSYERRNYERAETFWKSALSIVEKAFGPEHPATADRLDDLAQLYYALGQKREAQALWQRACSICDKMLGPEHPRTMGYLNQLNKLQTE